MLKKLFKREETITLAEHEAIVASIRELTDDAIRERDEAREELVLVHQRRIAPLMQANARRKREAAERKSEGN